MGGEASPIQITPTEVFYFPDSEGHFVWPTWRITQHWLKGPLPRIPLDVAYITPWAGDSFRAVSAPCHGQPFLIVERGCRFLSP